MGGGAVVAAELKKLGRMRRAEWAMLAVFLTTALLWILREPVKGWGWAPMLGLFDVVDGRQVSYVHDATVAIAMALVCFTLPLGDRPGEPLLKWSATKRVPWGILLLIGGGLALGDAMQASGLAKYLGVRLADVLSGLPPSAMAAATATGMTLLTELTSNLASVNMILPVLADAARSLHIDPRVLMIPATLAASCAFMLPVATPPNAIVYGSGRIKIRDMIKAGVYMNLLGVVLVVLAVLFLGMGVLDISLVDFPAWAAGP